ncbi:hypothetical protein GF377_00345 [candidate division GN15 bacterium]|nr:hypothetical protein [candidate division GN15 bacterium]
MTEEKTGGMSKGCVVGLIIVGVLAILVIALGVVCWVYKDDMARMPINAVLTQMNTHLDENEVAGVDPDAFQEMSDEFRSRIEQEENLFNDRYGVFMTAIQDLASKSEFNAEDYQTVTEAMVGYYPDMEDMAAQVVSDMGGDEAMMEIDTTEMVEDTAGAR